MSIVAPPHGRINHHCYPRWNNGGNSLEIIWSGNSYTPAWKFMTEADGYGEPGLRRDYVQRLFCTDCGVVGYYEYHNNEPTVAHFHWLLDKTKQVVDYDLEQFSADYGYLLKSSNRYGPGSVLVIGDILYFYTYYKNSPSSTNASFPFLGALQFYSYDTGGTIDDRWQILFQTFRVIENKAAFSSWDSDYEALIYPAGQDAVTVSFSHTPYLFATADCVISINKDTPLLLSQILAGLDEHVTQASSPMLTVKGYACLNNEASLGALCYKLPRDTFTAGGWFTYGQQLYDTWHPFLGSSFPSFRLPTDLYLPGDILAVSGLGSIIVFEENSLYAFTSHEASSSIGISKYSLAEQDPLLVWSTQPLVTPTDLDHVPRAARYEVSYYGTIIKWQFSEQEHSFALVATNLAEYEYQLINFTCQSGHYDTSGTIICSNEPCPVGHRCPGGSSPPIPCEENWYQSAEGQDRCLECPPYSSSSQGATTCNFCPKGMEQISGQCVPCPVGRYADGSTQNCIPCPPGTYADTEGASECEPCGIGHFNAESGQQSCTACTSGHYTAVVEGPQYVHVDRGATACVACPAGYTCNGAAPVPCPAGTVSASESTKCVICGPSLYQPLTGQSSCLECPAESGVDVTHSTCTPCSQGFSSYFLFTDQDHGCVTPSPVWNYPAVIMSGGTIARLFTLGCALAASNSVEPGVGAAPVMSLDYGATSLFLTCGYSGFNFHVSAVTPFIITIGLGNSALSPWVSYSTNSTVLLSPLCSEPIIVEDVLSSDESLPFRRRTEAANGPRCYHSAGLSYGQERPDRGEGRHVLTQETVEFVVTHAVPVLPDVDYTTLSCSTPMTTRIDAIVIDPVVERLSGSHRHTFSSDLAELLVCPLFWVDSYLSTGAEVTLYALTDGACAGLSVLSEGVTASSSVVVSKMPCVQSVVLDLTLFSDTGVTQRTVASLGDREYAIDLPVRRVSRLLLSPPVLELSNDATVADLRIEVTVPGSDPWIVSDCGAVYTLVSEQIGVHHALLRLPFSLDAPDISSCHITVSAIDGHFLLHSAEVTATIRPKSRALVFTPVQGQHYSQRRLLIGTVVSDFIDSVDCRLYGTISIIGSVDVNGDSLLVRAGTTLSVPIYLRDLSTIYPQKTVVTLRLVRDDSVIETKLMVHVPLTAYSLLVIYIGVALLVGVAVAFVAGLLHLRTVILTKALGVLRGLGLSSSKCMALEAIFLDPSDLFHTNVVIGTGGFGRVVRGEWNGANVAVKVLHKDLALDPDVLDSMAREAVIQSQLRHPHIVTLYGVTIVGGSLALVQELCDGSLKMAVYGRSYDRVSLDQRVRWMADAASAFAFMHARGLAHRDIKAANILLQGNHIKIADLGLTRGAKERAGATGMDTALGTPAWCAPEVIEGLKYDDQDADVYSFGIMMWELLAGDQPFSDIPPLAVTIQVVKNNSRPQIDPSWPRNLVALMQQAWSRQPDDRPTMQQLAVALSSMDKTDIDRFIWSPRGARSPAASEIYISRIHTDSKSPLSQSHKP